MPQQVLQAATLPPEAHRCSPRPHLVREPGRPHPFLPPDVHRCSPRPRLAREPGRPHPLLHPPSHAHSHTDGKARRSPHIAHSQAAARIAPPKRSGWGCTEERWRRLHISRCNKLQSPRDARAIAVGPRVGLPVGCPPSAATYSTAMLPCMSWSSESLPAGWYARPPRRKRSRVIISRGSSRAIAIW